MKDKWISLIFLIFIVSVSFSGVRAENDEWKEAPIITSVVELAKEKIFLEWSGNADLYQVYVDGKKIATVNLKYTIIDLKNGSHQISILPINSVSREGEKNFSLNFEMTGASEQSPANEIFKYLGIPELSAGVDLDLGALGIDAKDILTGTSSDIFKFKYTAAGISDATPEVVSAVTDFNNCVSLTFRDKYDSDVYDISIKSGKDVTHAVFDTSSEDAVGLITKDNSTVTVILDHEFLNNQQCMLPELDQKYSFSVKLQKWPVNFVTGDADTNALLESKESKAFVYTPYAAWKNAPVITYASQTADGQITLAWEHNDNGLGCEYRIVRHDMLLGVKKGVKEIGITSEKQYVIDDLMNGKLVYSVIPLYSGEQGFESESASIEVENNWVVAPALTCEHGDTNEVILRWSSPAEVESYHITVSVASGSLLRFVNLDYKKFEEFDVEADPGEMSYTYQYNQNGGSDSSTDLKFEIYGIRHTADGAEQKSASTEKMISIR